MSILEAETQIITRATPELETQELMLDLKNLKKVYPTPKGDYIVLEDLNLQIMKEEIPLIEF